MKIQALNLSNVIENNEYRKTQVLNFDTHFQSLLNMAMHTN